MKSWSLLPMIGDAMRRRRKIPVLKIRHRHVDGVGFGAAALMLVLSAMPAWAAPSTKVSTQASDGDDLDGCYETYSTANGPYNPCAGNPNPIFSGSVSGSSTHATANSRWITDPSEGVTSAAFADTASGVVAGSSVQTDTSIYTAQRGSSYAEIDDVLHYVIPGATASTRTAVQFTTSVATQTGTKFGTFSNFGFFIFEPDGTQGGYSAYFGALNGAPNDHIQQGFEPITVNSFGPAGADITVTAYVAGASGDIGIEAFAECYADFDGDCTTGPGDTGRSFAALPQSGVSFTSDSRVFPLNSLTLDGAVPEPSTWALMLSGFGIVGGAMRRRKPSAGIA